MDASARQRMDYCGKAQKSILGDLLNTNQLLRVRPEKLLCEAYGFIHGVSSPKDA